MTFRFVEFPIPVGWSSHWPHRFDLTYKGPDQISTKRSILTLDARLDLIDRACLWCEREMGEGGRDSTTWFFSENTAMMFINRVEHAFAFKLMFG